MLLEYVLIAGINDGAAIVLLASDRALSDHGLKSLARIIGTVAVGCDPLQFGLGPVTAVRRLCDETGWDLAAVDAVEVNEALFNQNLENVLKLIVGLCLLKVQ